MDQNHIPALMRRQSLPEGLLSTTKARSLAQQNAGNSLVSTSSKSPTDVVSSGMLRYKYLEENRFERQSKRKSQSLYESYEVKPVELSKSEDAISLEHHTTPPLMRNFSSPAGSKVFASMLKPDKKLSLQQDEQELDFLIQHHQQYPSSTSTTATNETKNDYGQDVSQTVFPSRQKLVKGVSEIMGNMEKTNFLETSAYENLHNQTPEDYAPLLGQHPIHSQSVPHLNHAYDNFHYSGLSSLAPLPNMNGFPMNPLNNFNIYETNALPGYSNVAFHAPVESLSMEITKKTDIKKRRSRVPSSVYRGVSRCGKDKKFQARIRVNGKVKYLGRFKSEIEAAKCYDKHAVEYLGVNAQTNFPTLRPNQLPN